MKNGISSRDNSTRIVTSSTLKGKWQEPARSESCVCAKKEQRCVQDPNDFIWYSDTALLNISFVEREERKEEKGTAPLAMSLPTMLIEERRRCETVRLVERNRKKRNGWEAKWNEAKRTVIIRALKKLRVLEEKGWKIRQSSVREVNRFSQGSEESNTTVALRLEIRCSWDTVSLIGNYRAKASLMGNKWKLRLTRYHRRIHKVAKYTLAYDSMQLRLREQTWHHIGRAQTKFPSSKLSYAPINRFSARLSRS